MENFINDKFMLQSELAQELYQHIKNNPIIDFHSHLSAEEIYNNTRYKSITEAWLYHDHYKWRQMRTAGIDESLITGNASDYDKFLAYAETLEYAIGNPLFHWSQLELKTYFGIDQILSRDTAPDIFVKTNNVIAQGNVDVLNILKQSNVKFIATTDDICSDLEYHLKIAANPNIEVVVTPTFRPDRFLNFGDENYLLTLAELECVTHKIKTYDDFILAMIKRIEFFEQAGCRISDHGQTYFDFMDSSIEECNEIFNKLIQGNHLSSSDQIKLQSKILVKLASEYKNRDWVLQLHIGATRDNNQELFDLIGHDAGADAISDRSIVIALSDFLKTLSAKDGLGKTVIYNLNPSENYPICALIGSFQKGPQRGLIQFGSGWWFNDQKDGMINQLSTHSQLGLLRVFIGMLTDSRSFLSMTRHDYFRRILCNYIAELVLRGEYPNDTKLLYSIVDEISYKNASAYFKV